VLAFVATLDLGVGTLEEKRHGVQKVLAIYFCVFVSDPEIAQQKLRPTSYDSNFGVFVCDSQSNFTATNFWLQKVILAKSFI
jgi:hypothetical protein